MSSSKAAAAAGGCPYEGRRHRETKTPIDLDTFIERLRSDVFDVYATVRQAQRESALPQSERAAILATAGHRARSIADVINLYCAVPVLGLDAGEAFGVPI